MLCGTVGFLEAAADAPAKSTQSESDQQTLRCSRWWWKIFMLILIMAMVTVVTPPPPMHALKKVFLSYTATFRMGDGGTSLQESKCLAGIFQQIVTDCKVPMSFFVAKQTFPMQCQPDRSGILDCA